MRSVIVAIAILFLCVKCAKKECPEIEVTINGVQLTENEVDFRIGQSIPFMATFQGISPEDAISVEWRMNGTESIFGSYIYTTIKESIDVEVIVSNGKCTKRKLFRLNAVVPTVIDCEEYIEPNDELSTATIVMPNATINSALTNSESDIYKFSTDGSQTNIIIRLTNLPSNYDIDLYNASGTWIKRSAKNQTNNEVIIYNSTVEGTYYVKVSNTNGFSSSSCYTLSISSSAIFTCDDLYESNESTFTAWTLNNLNMHYEASISSGTDIDYFRIYSSSYSNITISLSMLPANYNLEVYSNSNVLLYSSVNTGTTSETISFSSSNSTYYYIRVSGASSSQFSNDCYTLGISAY